MLTGSAAVQSEGSGMASQYSQQRNRLGNYPHTFACLPLIALAVSGLINPTHAAPAGLAGSWSGGGWVSFASGNKEKARCHAHYSRQSETSYALSATCATASGKASQTATLRKVGANSYSGGFQNSEYNISGNIYVVVHGNSQSIRLSGGGASASLSLSR
jgi:hypothetical protein